MSDSRRGVLALHAHDQAKMARCPVCRWAIEQDHAEALAMTAAGTGKEASPASPRAPQGKAVPEPEGVLGFALV